MPRAAQHADDGGLPGGASEPTVAKIPLLRRMLTARGRQLEITKAGWLFIVLALAVGFAAINSGANLLHVAFGIQLGLIVASGALSENMVRRARARRRPVSPLHAGQPAAIEVQVRNASARADIIAVSVEDDDRVVGAGVCAPVFSLVIARGETVTLHSTVTMPRRGRHPLPPAVVVTRFPFGLFVKRRDLPETGEVLVYPRVHQLDLRALGLESRGEGESAAAVMARAGELYGLDEYRDGDDLRRINWPATARLGKLVVCEYESHGDREVWIDLAAGVAGDPQFEIAVEEAASLAVALLREGRIAAGLRVGGAVVLPPAAGPAHERALLEHLAVVGFADEANDEQRAAGDTGAAPDARNREVA